MRGDFNASHSVFIAADINIKREAFVTNQVLVFDNYSLFPKYELGLLAEKLA